jgi:hypothetical protein
LTGSGALFRDGHLHAPYVTYPHGSEMFVSLTSTEMILSPYRNFQIFALGNFSQLSLSYPRKPVSR